MTSFLIDNTEFYWTEEHGRLQSMGSLRVGHEWATSLSLFTFMHWRRKWQPTPVFFPGECHGQRSLVGYSPWGCEESDITERLTLVLWKHLWEGEASRIGQREELGLDEAPTEIEPTSLEPRDWDGSSLFHSGAIAGLASAELKHNQNPEILTAIPVFFLTATVHMLVFEN